MREPPAGIGSGLGFAAHPVARAAQRHVPVRRLKAAAALLSNLRRQTGGRVARQRLRHAATGRIDRWAHAT